MKKNQFREEMIHDLQKLKELIRFCKDKKRAIKITFFSATFSPTYWVEKNKHVIEMLKKEYKLIKKKL